MKIRKEGLSKLVLLALEKAVDGYVRFEDFTYHSYRYHYGAPELKKSALAAALRRLRTAGYIERDINQGRVIFKLTALGKETLHPEFDENKWDGRWRIVMFDIPENKRTVRDLLRRRLKEWGFKQWQKSLWVTKKDVTDKLRKIVHDLEINNWVAVIESNDVALSNIIFHDR